MAQDRSGCRRAEDDGPDLAFALQTGAAHEFRRRRIPEQSVDKASAPLPPPPGPVYVAPFPTSQPSSGRREARKRGGVAEWLKAHAWKVCIRETVSRVRIPLPPPVNVQISQPIQSGLYPGASCRPRPAPSAAAARRKPIRASAYRRRGVCTLTAQTVNARFEKRERAWDSPSISMCRRRAWPQALSRGHPAAIGAMCARIDAGFAGPRKE